MWVGGQGDVPAGGKGMTLGRQEGHKKRRAS